MKVNRIPTLLIYSDWLEKAKHELSRFEQSCNVYDMANCFLTLNALPEWVAKDDRSTPELKEIATRKISIMKGQDFELDENKLNELDHQLRLIRLFCNHSKHGDKKKQFKHIAMGPDEPFKMDFPIKFDNLFVGSKLIKINVVLENVINFWSDKFEDA